MIVLIGISIWILCGIISVYLVGLAERLFTYFESDNDGILLLCGPLSILMVCLLYIMLIVTSVIKSQLLENISQTIKKKVRGY